MRGRTHSATLTSRGAFTVAGLVALALGATACTPTCQSTCSRYYSVEECDAKPAGIGEADALKACTQVCEAAIVQPGPAPAVNDTRFSGTAPAPPTKSPQITNELEAAAWMDCVWSFETREECNESLDKQYCVQLF